MPKTVILAQLVQVSHFQKQQTTTKQNKNKNKKFTAIFFSLISIQKSIDHLTQNWVET